MSLLSALIKLWNDSALSLSTSGYAVFNIEAHIVCTAVLVILFICQQGSSEHTEVQVIWDRMLSIQILYCISGILRVLVDVSIIHKTNISQYLVTAANFGLFGCLCWLTFVYIAVYQKAEFFDAMRNKIITALPFIFNVINLILSPFTGSFIDISGESMTNGVFFPLMVTINLSYPVAASLMAFMRRNRMGRYERTTLSRMAVYPAFFMVCGPLQALNWRIPFLCYAIMVSDIFVYISHTDSLVSVDPLTHIPNKNGLIKHISERLGQEHPELLHVFAVGLDDISSIISSHGRLEGDKALIVTAEALTKFMNEEHPCYISRYYRDEFIITSDIEDNEELELFVEHIRNYVSNASISHNLPYHLSASVGTSHYEQFSKTETISGLIDEAGRSLAEGREQKRFQAMWRDR